MPRAPQCDVIITHSHVFGNVVVLVCGNDIGTVSCEIGERNLRNGHRQRLRKPGCQMALLHDRGSGRRERAAMSYQHRGEARRVGRVKVGDPIPKLKAHQLGESPRRAARNRRQHVSSVTLIGATAVVARVRVGVLRGRLGAPARVCAAGISHVYRALLNPMAASPVARAAVNGVLIVQASTC